MNYLRKLVDFFSICPVNLGEYNADYRNNPKEYLYDRGIISRERAQNTSTTTVGLENVSSFNDTMNVVKEHKTRRESENLYKKVGQN